MTDLKSRADELISTLIVYSVRHGGAHVDCDAFEPELNDASDALTRFVHALCDAAESLGISRTWAQHHSNCAMLQVFGKCDCGLSEFRPEMESALAALEKGEKA